MSSEDGPPSTEIRHRSDGPVLVSHRFRLVVESGPDAGREIDVAAPRASIGSAASNDLVLGDPASSRQHCEIVVRDDRYVLRDLGSTNGTFVRDVRVLEAVLEPGARIAIGDSIIEFAPRQRFVRVPPSEASSFGALVGRSAPMRQLFGLLARVAPTALSVLVLGETGTGKELVARALHDHSPRRGEPFVVVDCGAVSATLVDDELFGHERGAFTGADRQRIGAFEAARGGTLVLDEVGELPLEMQPKLLRVLERREIRRLGGRAPIEIDVRIIAATHRPLPQMVREGTFREDLYYRLAEVAVEITPLRERIDDIAVIAERIVADEAERGGRVRRIAPGALARLGERRWRGNARELRNVVRRAIALGTSDVLTIDDLAAADALVPAPPSAASDARGLPAFEGTDALPLDQARERWAAALEPAYLTSLMRRAGGDLDDAAASAGIHRKSFLRLLRRHGIARPSDTDDEA